MLGVMAALDQLAHVQVAQGVAQALVAANGLDQARGQWVGGEQHARLGDRFRVGEADHSLADDRHRTAVVSVITVHRPQGFAQAAVVSLVGTLTDPVSCVALHEQVQKTVAQGAYGVTRGVQNEGAGGQWFWQLRHRQMGFAGCGTAEHGIPQGQDRDAALAGDTGAMAFFAVGLPGNAVEQFAQVFIHQSNIPGLQCRAP